MKENKKDRYMIGLPYVSHNGGFFGSTGYELTDNDIAKLKKSAKDEGRSLKSFIAGKLKEIANIEPE